jgi:hypothetical protein
VAIPIRLVDEGTDWPACIQAAVSILALLAVFVVVLFQKGRDQCAAGRAAKRLAHHALEALTERMAAIIDPTAPMEYALRGVRAAEAIRAFQEINIGTLPEELMEPIAIVRSGAAAANSRIDEIFKAEARDKRRIPQRPDKLVSAAKVLVESRKTARTKLELKGLKLKPPSASMIKYLNGKNIDHGE